MTSSIQSIDSTATTVISPFDAYAENMRIMNEIVMGMKEEQAVVADTPKDLNPLLKVEFPKEGGILTWMENFPNPYKGFPHFEFVDKIDLGKKIIRSFISGIYHRFKRRSKLRLLLLLPSLWLASDAVRSLLYIFYRLIERLRLRNERYSDSVRELYRAFSVERASEKKDERELRMMLRDSVCMFLEFDNAYRFRMQDILVLLDKEALRRNTIGELLRLLKIMQSREATQEVSDTWKLGMYLFRFYLKGDKELVRIIRNVLNEIDLSKIKMDSGDVDYSSKRKDYKFGFMQNI